MSRRRPGGRGGGGGGGNRGILTTPREYSSLLNLHCKITFKKDSEPSPLDPHINL